MVDSRLQEFFLSSEALTHIGKAFCRELEGKMAGESSSLKMLSSYLAPATGAEQGVFLALDFGGTNVRILEIELLGERTLQIRRKCSFPLKSKDVDYTSDMVKGKQLFEYIAQEIAAFIVPGKEYLLGHTFSFPFLQQQQNQALLLAWTKEIRTNGVIGQDVTSLLQAALAAYGLAQIRPVAVVNDTVATLLAASYGEQAVTIGAICGTGYNSCYVETAIGEPVVINLEAGNFSGVKQTKWDEWLDQGSDYPGEQRLEKQVSAGYLGKLVTLIFADLRGRALTKETDFTGEDLSHILRATEGSAIIAIAAGRGFTISEEESGLLVKVAATAIVRSARLAAASFAGILFHVDRLLCQNHCIAIDGSLYEKMPGYSDALQQGINDIFGEKAQKIRLVLCKDGSGMGAAVAAALQGTGGK